MTIHSISDRSAAVYLTQADLTPHGLTPATLTLTQARTLLRSPPLPPPPPRPLRQTRIRHRPT